MPALRALGALHWRHQVMTKLKASGRHLGRQALEAYAETRMQGRRLILGTQLSYTQRYYTASRFVGGRTAFRCCRPVWLRTGSGAS